MAKTYADLLQEVKAAIRQVSLEDLKDRLDSGEGVILVDVREKDEWRQGHVPGALHIPRGFLEMQSGSRLPDKDAKIVTICAAGIRSAFAAKVLQDLGYNNVESANPGFNQWKDQGLPTTQPFAFTDAQLNRYSRHLLLPEVGEQGQAKLLQGRVLLLGAGGLGSPAALYLAAAGVGTIGLVDGDTVDESNLQRQVLHGLDRVGESKVESGKRTIENLNPDVNVIAFNERLTRQNVDSNFRSRLGRHRRRPRQLRHALPRQRRQRLEGLPVVHGSIFRFDGQVTTFWPRHGPCYRCLYPEPPPPDGAELRGGRRSRRAARRHRHAAGDRGRQNRSRARRPLGRPTPAVRLAPDAVPHLQAPAQQRLPGLRRPPDHHRRSFR